MRRLVACATSGTRRAFRRRIALAEEWVTGSSATGQGAFRFEFDRLTGAPLVFSSPAISGSWKILVRSDIDFVTGDYSFEGIDGALIVSASAARNDLAPAEFGDLCGGAADRATCRTEVDALAVDTSNLGSSVFAPPCGEFLLRTVHVIVTVGDEVRLVAPDDLPAVIGEVTSPDEAAMLVGGQWAAETGDGFVVHRDTVVADCAPFVLTASVHTVKSDGGDSMADVMYSVAKDVCS
jgi:hypothetical protein